MEKQVLCGAVMCALVIGGCAAPGEKMSGAQSGATIGASVAGASTFLLCRLSGRSAQTCLVIAAAGAAVGGAIGWQQGKEKDLAEVKAMTENFQKVGVPASVEVAQVAGKDEKGKPVNAESFKAITVPLDPIASEIKSDNPDVVKAMQDLGVLSVTRVEPTRVIYRMSSANGDKVKTWMNEGIAQGKQANPKGSDPTIQELTYEKGKPEFVRVEPKDQSQFAMAGEANILASTK